MITHKINIGIYELKLVRQNFELIFSVSILFAGLLQFLVGVK